VPLLDLPNVDHDGLTPRAAPAAKPAHAAAGAEEAVGTVMARSQPNVHKDSKVRFARGTSARTHACHRAL
jgi:hypothetical protein